MPLSFIAIFSISFFIFAVKRLEWAVLSVIFALPLYVVRFKFFVLPSTLLEIMILSVFAAWLFFYSDIPSLSKSKAGVKAFLARQGRTRYPFDTEIILLALISFLSVAFAGFSSNAFGIWKAYFFEPLLLYVVVFNVFKDKDLTKLIWPMALSAIVVSLLAVYQKFTGAFIENEFWRNPETRRATSVFGYPNAVGLYLAPLAMIFSSFISKLWSEKKKNFLQISILALAVVSSLSAVYSAKSEGALIGIIAGLFVMCLFSGKALRVAAIGVAAIGTVLVLSVPAAREYALEKALLKDLSGEIRKQQWRETFEMMNGSRAVFGTGLDSYKKAIEPFHQEGIFFNKDKDSDFRRKIVIFDERYKLKYWQPTEVYHYPHNIILNFWTELGVAGAMLFAWLIGRFFYYGIALAGKEIEDKLLVIGLIGAMAAITVHGLVDVPYFKNDLSAMFWILFAMLGILKVRQELKEPS